MTSIAPVRPQLDVNNDPLPGDHRRVRGGDEEQDDEGMEDQDYECTGPGDANEDVNEDKDLFADEHPDNDLRDIPEQATSDPILCPPCGNARIPNKLSSPIKPSA